MDIKDKKAIEVLKDAEKRMQKILSEAAE